jgi:lysophospholipase L1-like esterase
MSPQTPIAASSPRLTWKTRLRLLGFGLLVSLFLLETGLRIVDAFRDPRLDEGWGESQASSSEYWAIYDPDLGYRQNPKFADMNAHGLRDRPIGPKSGRFRVLFLGDSLAVYGDSVDDTFVGHLRTTLLSDAKLDTADVVNAGIKGYTNYQELLFLKKIGLSLEPDLVGFEFCVNDLFKFLHSFDVQGDRLVPGTYQFSTEAVGQSHEPVWARWAKRSRLLVWLNNNLAVARNAALWGMRQGFSFDYRTDVRNAWRDEPWVDIESQLREAVELGKLHGFPVFVVAFPLASQYDADYLAKDRAYVLKPQRKLAEICARLGIPFYDLYKDLGGGHFVEDGLHLTSEGRRAAGQAIAAFLTRSGLLPH